MIDNERVVGAAFATLLRRHRLAAGLSQEDLAERAGMSARGIGALERGDRRYPYRETVVLLAQALGLAPAVKEQFEAAAARPRQRRPGVDDGKAASPQAPRPTTNLPLQRTSLIGRETEIADVAGMLRDGRLVTITGAGGLGKSRAALAVGEAYVKRALAEVWFVDLAPLVQESVVAGAIARALSVNESPKEPLLETLAAYLKPRSVLLILDNCEHLIAGAAAIADALLRRCPKLCILATSRESLRTSGEHVFRLPSLQVPTPQDALQLSAAAGAEYAAVLLFLERARAIDQHFVLKDDNAPIVAEICRRLDGIPLAIELAAARVKGLSLRALSQKLGEQLRLLTGGERTTLPRHQTMRALIDWSYDLLSSPERRLFERLSIFAGGCVLSAAATVYTDSSVDEFAVFELLTSLVDKSLVAVELTGLEPRYRLLESTRQYAAAKLAARGDAQRVAQRHAFAYLELAERLEAIYDAAPEPSWRPQVETEFDNWRAALRWAVVERGDVVLGQNLVGSLWHLWPRSVPVEGLRWVRAALGLTNESTPLKALAKLDYAESRVAARLDDYPTALASALRAMVRYRQLGDELGTLRAQHRAGQAHIHLGQTADGMALLRDGLSVARRLRHRALVCGILMAIAHARVLSGDRSSASREYGEAQTIFTELGDEHGVALVTLELAEVQFEDGEVESAVSLMFDALARFRALGDRYHTAHALSYGSAYLIHLHRYDEAERYAMEALDIARQQQLALTSTLQRLAALAALRAQDDTEGIAEICILVARTFGFIDARIAPRVRPPESAEQQEYDRVIELLRCVLGARKLADIMSAGASITEDEAIAAALAARKYFRVHPSSIDRTAKERNAGNSRLGALAGDVPNTADRIGETERDIQAFRKAYADH